MKADGSDALRRLVIEAFRAVAQIDSEVGGELQIWWMPPDAEAWTEGDKVSVR
jgi:hypothetical protein